MRVRNIIAGASAALALGSCGGPEVINDTTETVPANTRTTEMPVGSLSEAQCIALGIAQDAIGEPHSAVISANDRAPLGEAWVEYKVNPADVIAASEGVFGSLVTSQGTLLRETKAYVDALAASSLMNVAGGTLAGYYEKGEAQPDGTMHHDESDFTGPNDIEIDVELARAAVDRTRAEYCSI